jgi:hypothetical protein
VNSGGKDDAISEFQPSPPPFDRIHMPFMELNSASHSESKHFEDLMASPALNLSFSRSGSAHRDRRTERYVFVYFMYKYIYILSFYKYHTSNRSLI